MSSIIDNMTEEEMKKIYTEYRKKKYYEPKKEQLMAYMKEYNKKYNAEHSAEKREYNKAYTEMHKETLRNYAREYARAHKKDRADYYLKIKNEKALLTEEEIVAKKNSVNAKRREQYKLKKENLKNDVEIQQ